MTLTSLAVCPSVTGTRSSRTGALLSILLLALSQGDNLEASLVAAWRRRAPAAAGPSGDVRLRRVSHRAASLTLIDGGVGGAAAVVKRLANRCVTGLIMADAQDGLARLGAIVLLFLGRPPAAATSDGACLCGVSRAAGILATTSHGFGHIILDGDSQGVAASSIAGKLRLGSLRETGLFARATGVVAGDIGVHSTARSRGSPTATSGHCSELTSIRPDEFDETIR